MSGRAAAAPSPAGYSGTPLAKKLGFRPDTRLVLFDAPADYATWLGALPAGLRQQPRVDAETTLVHLFVTRRQALETQLVALRGALSPTAAVWVSWPKRASKLPSEVTEDTVRELALPLGFVDIKVCAVSAVWSGLKLVVRRSLRD